MRWVLLFTFLFLGERSKAQSPDEEIDRWMDTMRMGGQQNLGKFIPGFSLETTEGEIVTDKALKGKITFINFWFESCAPCIAELGAMEGLYNRFKTDDRFQFLSITYESKAAVDAMRLKYAMSYPVLLTSIQNCIHLNYRNGFPTTIITDESGKIVFFTFGGGIDIQKEEMKFKTYIYPLLTSLLNCLDRSKL